MTCWNCGRCSNCGIAEKFANSPQGCLLSCALRRLQSSELEMSSVNQLMPGFLSTWVWSAAE